MNVYPVFECVSDHPLAQKWMGKCTRTLDWHRKVCVCVCARTNVRAYVYVSHILKAVCTVKLSTLSKNLYITTEIKTKYVCF